MVKLILGPALLLLLTGHVIGQDLQAIDLPKAYELAERNYPVTKQTGLIEQTASINIDNLNKGYLPQVTLSGQATYQSQVTKVPVTIPGFTIESPSKDQYRVVADVNQLIYDGDAIKQQKTISQLTAAVDNQRV